MTKPTIKLLVVTLGVLAACSSRAPHASTGGVSGDDAGAANTDGAVEPAPARDSGANVVVGDDSTALCTYADADRLVLGLAARPSVLASAASRSGFGVVFQRADGALFVSAVAHAGAPEPASAITSASEQAEAPALVATDTSFLLGYRSSSAGRSQLHVRALTSAGPTKLTDDLTIPSGPGETWAISAGPAGFAAVWLEAPSGELHARMLDASAAVSGGALTIALAAGHVPAHVALARYGSGDYLLALRELDADSGDQVFGQRLSAALEARGAATQLSKHALASDAPFGLSARSGSAGLFYPALDGGVRKALKLRRVTEAAAPEGPVLNLADAPRVVDSGAIAAFGRGYALVYRELPSLGRDHAALRIAFVNPFGSVVYDAELAVLPADASQVATSVASGPDAELLVTWTDAAASASTASVRGLRMVCEGALVLCGGHAE